MTKKKNYRSELKAVLFEHALHQLNNRNHKLFVEARENGFEGDSYDFMQQQEEKIKRKIKPSVLNSAMFKDREIIFVHAFYVTEKKIKELDADGVDYEEAIESLKSSVAIERKEILTANRPIEIDDEIDALLEDLEI